MTATYTKRDSGPNDISVVNRPFFWPLLSYFDAPPACARCHPWGKCRVIFSGDCSEENLAGGTNYNVLETDYTRYTLVYGCEESLGGLGITEDMWILTRETSISDELKKEL